MQKADRPSFSRLRPEPESFVECRVLPFPGVAFYLNDIYEA